MPPKDTLDYKLVINIHCKMFYQNKLIDAFYQLKLTLLIIWHSYVL